MLLTFMFLLCLICSWDLKFQSPGPPSVHAYQFSFLPAVRETYKVPDVRHVGDTLSVLFRRALSERVRYRDPRFHRGRCRVQKVLLAK